MPRQDDDGPLLRWPWRILEAIPSYWFLILSVVGAVVGSLYAHYHGYKVLKGLVLGAFFGFLFLPLLTKAVELAVAAAIIGGVIALIYYVFFKN